MLTLVSKKTRLLVASAMLVLGLVSTASAYFYVYPSYSYPSGRSYSNLAADWWKWVLSVPASRNPLLDTTGANCRQGQPNNQFFFLAGATDSTPVVRNCTVPVGKTIVFPLVNAFYGAFPTDPAAERREAFVRGQVEYAKGATNLFLEVDGVRVNNLNQYFERSALFRVVLPADNILGGDAGQVLDPSADAGYYVALAPWEPGKHTIRFKATLDGTNIDVTYNITQSFLP